MSIASDCELCNDLCIQLGNSVRRNKTDAILLSGGLDSTVLASILRPELAITVVGQNNAADLGYSRKAAKMFCSKHIIITVEVELLPELIEFVVHAMKTFDPIEIRNSIVLLAGIRCSKQAGYESVMTGDGGDELFAGYNFLSRYYTDPVRLQEEVQRLWNVMHFSSLKLGKLENVQVETPFLDNSFAEFAKSIPVHCKIGMNMGRMWGKFILRKCFENTLGELSWRDKMALEVGSGIEPAISTLVESTIDNSRYRNGVDEATKQQVKIRSKEHLYYYELFLNHFEPPSYDRVTVASSAKCPDCHAYIAPDGRFCRTCGAFPVTPIPWLL
jgi:asparagine synthase (glutamine-hydrolysing)